MDGITTRQFKILSDHMDVYRFMTEIYRKDWGNGVPAPFFEYALSSSWMDKSYIHRNRIWMENHRIVGFCFTENPVNDILFSLRPGYEELADEMVTYASEFMPKPGSKNRLIIFKGQKAIMETATRAGYKKANEFEDMIFDFEEELNYELPKGFHFVKAEDINVDKVSECCWKGFDHEEEEGPWDGDAEHNYHLLQAPHATPQYQVVIANDKEEYVCFAGMWWTPENNLAYMEPLCTIPEYRGQGLAAAALSCMYRKMKALGATHMTGGDIDFYKKIGYKPMIPWSIWERNDK